MKIVICGTYPTQFNGYSKVLYELLKELAAYKDLLKISVFGFQNYHENKQHEAERSLPDHIELYDAFKNENPKEKGFGENLIEGFIKERDPDVVIVYNDLIVLSTFLNKLDSIPNRRFKLIPYVDLVYENEKNSLVNFVHEHSDGAIMFTNFWDSVIKSQGYTKPTYVMQHGFNPNNHYPIPRHVARAWFNIPDGDFVIINLNRNQPRKRWDICIMSFVKFLSMHPGKPIRLVIGTALTGAWDLVDIFVSECRKYGLDPEQAKHHLILVNNPQTLSDKDVNILYNAADVGFNTCDGEGFGLCNFEQGGIGVPQVVSYVGGFKEFFDSKNTVVVPPRWSYYVDSMRDVVGGEARVCDIGDLCSALNIYYNNPELREKHGKACRERIAKSDTYKWSAIAARFVDIMVASAQVPISQSPSLRDPAPEPAAPVPAPEPAAPAPVPVPVPAAAAPERPLQPIVEDEENVDVRKISNCKPILTNVEVFEGMADVPVVKVDAGAAAPAPAAAPAAADDSESDEEELDIAYLEKLNKKISKMLLKKKRNPAA